MLDRIWGERLRHLVQNTLYADHDEFRESVASLPLSYRQLARHFRADVGMSIKQYQIQERIKEAKRLLRNTGLSVTDVAFELHYASSQKFAAQFKAVTGMTPGEYRGR
jgi:AraC-like DNA-binding protein